MDWHYDDGTATHGPFAFDELKALHRSGALPDSARVWHEGQSGSTVAGDLFRGPVSASDPSRAQVPLAPDAGGRPTLANPTGHLVGLGGWLVLYSVGYVLGILIGGLSLVWVFASFAGGGFGEADGIVALSVVVVLVHNLVLAKLFFERSASWPDASIGLGIFAAAAACAAAVVSEDLMEVVVIIAGYAVHVAYVRNSVRVRNTFTKEEARGGFSQLYPGSGGPVGQFLEVGPKQGLAVVGGMVLMVVAPPLFVLALIGFGVYVVFGKREA